MFRVILSRSLLRNNNNNNKKMANATMPVMSRIAQLMPPNVAAQSTIEAQCNIDKNMPEERATTAERARHNPNLIITPMPSGQTSRVIFDVHPNEPVFVDATPVQVGTSGYTDTRKYAYTSFNGKAIPAHLMRMPPKRRQRAFAKTVLFVGVSSIPYLLSSPTQAEFGLTVLTGGGVGMVARREPLVAGFYATVAEPRVDPKEREDELGLTFFNADAPHGKQMGVLRAWNPYDAIDNDVAAPISEFYSSSKCTEIGLEALQPQSVNALEQDDEVALLFTRAVLGNAAAVILACVECNAITVNVGGDRTPEWRAHVQETVSSRSYDGFVGLMFDWTEGKPVSSDMQQVQINQCIQLFKELGLLRAGDGHTHPLHELKMRAAGLALRPFFDRDAMRELMSVLTLNPQMETQARAGFLDDNDDWRQLELLQENAARDLLRVNTEALYMHAARAHVKVINNMPIGLETLVQLVP
jgi:hypothetical protein